MRSAQMRMELSRNLGNMIIDQLTQKQHEALRALHDSLAKQKKTTELCVGDSCEVK